MERNQRRSRRLLVLAGAALLLVTGYPLVHGCLAARAAQAMAIREAVFRYEFQHEPDLDSRQLVFFLSVRDHDPPEALLRRLQGVRPVVKARSQYSTRPNSSEIIDKGTGRPGVIVQADRIHWRLPSVADVDGGYYRDGLCAAGIVYRVERQGKAWVVTRRTLKWIA